MGGRYIRCLAMRGVTSSDTAPIDGTELAAVQLRIQLNGQNDFIGGNETGFASLALLFGSGAPQPGLVQPTQRRRVSPPWLWFLSPPLFRAGDTITMTATNTDEARVMTPEVSLRLIDEEVWLELYTRDWRAERSA